MPLQVILWLVGMGILAFGGWEGRGYYDNAQLVAQLQAQIAANRQAVEAAQAAQAADDALLIDIGKQTTVFRDNQDAKTVYLTQKVPVYVTPKAVRACVVPIGFVQLLNTNAAPTAGAATLVPNPAPGATDTDSRVGLDTVADITIANYGRCNEALNRTNTAWPDWYVRAKKIYETWANTYDVWLKKQKP